MSAVNWTGFSGVMLLLSAYFLASVLLHYIPFTILEGAWVIIAVASLLKLKLKHAN
ncbi:MAG: hypothetical protein AAF934_04905 [Bacteroidota bacterium]